MEENLDEVKTDAPETGEPSEAEVETPEEEAELSDEELAQQIENLKEQAKNEKDPKEKRHLEQQAGWSQKISREREKARELSEQNRKTAEVNERYEKSLVEEVFSKTTDENFGLPYFENLYKTNPEIAERVAMDKWSMSAKQLIIETKRTVAETDWNEDFKKEVSKEDTRAEIYHEIAVEEAQSKFDDLEPAEKAEARENFKEMTEGKILTMAKAKQFAEMARMYALRNRKPETVPVDKERVLAEKASMGIAPKGISGNASAQTDVTAIRDQLISAGIPRHTVELMYPLN